MPRSQAKGIPIPTKGKTDGWTSDCLSLRSHPSSWGAPLRPASPGESPGSWPTMSTASPEQVAAWLQQWGRPWVWSSCPGNAPTARTRSTSAKTAAGARGDAGLPATGNATGSGSTAGHGRRRCGNSRGTGADPGTGRGESAARRVSGPLATVRPVAVLTTFAG